MSCAKGGCLCGALRYEVLGNPAKMTMCHCKFCQRATGGAYMVQPVFRTSEFTITKGRPMVYDHVSAGSGKTVHVNFCDACGTKIFLTFERFEGAIGLYGGTLDDPDCLTVPREGRKHIFLNFGQDETVISAHIDAFNEHVMLNDGTRAVPIVLDRPQSIFNIKRL